MTLNPLIIYICSVNIVCAYSTAMLFRSATTLTVRKRHLVVSTFNFKLSVITVCLTVIFELSWPRNLRGKTIVIDRLRFWKHCLPLGVFLVVVWSPAMTCLSLHKDVCMCAAPPYPQNSY